MSDYKKLQELPDKNGSPAAKGGSKWGAVKKDVADTSKKQSVQERMLELRRRKQERLMGKKEEQIDAGINIVNQSPIGKTNADDVTRNASAVPFSQGGLPEPSYPEYTTVPRWEEYFANLAADCLDGLVLNSSQAAMLRVHSAYSMALEDIQSASKVSA